MKKRTAAASAAMVVALSLLQSHHPYCIVNAFATHSMVARKKYTSRVATVQQSEQRPLQMAFKTEALVQSSSSTSYDNSSNDIPSYQPPIKPITQRTRFQGALALTAIITASNNGLHFQAIPIGESLLALLASVVLVSGATDAVERMTSSAGSSSMPAYDVNGERFDQSTFLGRYCKMLLACDPRLLLYTEEEVRKYHALAYKNYAEVRERALLTMEGDDNLTTNNNMAETDRLLWEAKRIADSALHPETNEWIPRPFRMSGYLPFNGPICIAMISVSSTLPLLFWSWMNQSQNAAVNYFNGPKTAIAKNNGAEETATNDNALNGTLLSSYAMAVASALVVAFGLATYIQSNYSGEEATQLLRFISFPSAVIASSLNCYIVRSPEIETGVPLLNDRMENVLQGETSCVAAKRGVYSTTASRAILQMPTYFIPPLILDTVTPLKQFLSEDPLMVVPITTFLLLVSFGIGLPCAVGLFPQRSQIKVEDVEEQFRGLGYEEFYYNKGL